MSTTPQEDFSSSQLTQDDFEWGEELQQSQPAKAATASTPEPAPPPPTAPMTPTAATTAPPETSATSATTPTKTTELDRIEFEEIEEPEIKSAAPSDDVDEKSPAAASKLSRYLGLFLTSKFLMLAGIIIVVLTGAIGMMVFLFSGGEAVQPETASIEFTQLDMPATYEHTLADFIVPVTHNAEAAFVSYKVRLVIKAQLYEYYLAKEDRIRADIFRTLQEVHDDENNHDFSELVKNKANALFGKNIIESASVISTDKM